MDYQMLYRGSLLLYFQSLKWNQMWKWTCLICRYEVAPRSDSEDSGTDEEEVIIVYRHKRVCVSKLILSNLCWLQIVCLMYIFSAFVSTIWPGAASRKSIYLYLLQDCCMIVCFIIHNSLIFSGRGWWSAPTIPAPSRREEENSRSWQWGCVRGRCSSYYRVSIQIFFYVVS